MGEDNGDDDDENEDEFADADGDADGDGDEAAESGEARMGGECCGEEEEEEEGRKTDVLTPSVSGEIERRCGMRDRRADDEEEEEDADPALPLA